MAPVQRFVRAAIEEAGYAIDGVKRVLAPYDVGEEIVVLFMGKLKPSKRMAIAGGQRYEPLTAWILDQAGAKAVVTEGW